MNFLMQTFIVGCYQISWNGNCGCNCLDNIIHWAKLCYVKEIQHFNKELLNKNYEDQIEKSLLIMINE